MKPGCSASNAISSYNFDGGYLYLTPCLPDDKVKVLYCLYDLGDKVQGQKNVILRGI